MSAIKERGKVCCGILMIVFYGMFSKNTTAQSVSYNQYMNGLSFAHPLKGKWATEFNTGSTFSSSSTNRSLFADYAQLMLNGGINNYFTSRWKFSFYTLYFYNKLITDVQPASVEWRFAPQATYFIHKNDYSLSTRLRFEMRYINEDKQGYKDNYRYRQMLRYLKPFNSRMILEGVWYGIASEELSIKLLNSTNQISIDRNFLNIGIGYSVTDNMQIELTYLNEFVPRSTNQIYNSLSLSFNFNNFFSNLNDNIDVIKRDLKSDE